MENTDWIIVGATIVIAVATCGAAIAAARSARASARATEQIQRSTTAELVLHFRQRYEAEEMRGSLNALREYCDQHGYEQSAITAFMTNPEAIDSDRRRVFQYFNTVGVMHQAGLIDDAFITTVFRDSAVSGLFELAYPFQRSHWGYPTGGSSDTVKIFQQLFDTAYEQAKSKWGSAWQEP